ncbi:MAG: metallophosphoesterase family protein [Limisphaerales bacterium]
MKFLIVADIHYSLKQFDWVASLADKFDAVFIVGDLLDLVSIVERDVQATVALKYLRNLATKTRVVVCSGNHDCKDKLPNGEWNATWLQEGSSERVSTDGETITIGETLFSIMPWWDGDIVREEVAKQIERDSDEARAQWAWIYHCPPHETPLSWNGKRHCGDPSAGKWIEDHQPDLVFTGHVHEAPFVRNGAWFHRIGNTFVFNAGRQHGAIPSFLVWNTEDRDVTWISQAGTERVSLENFSEVEVLA